MGRHLIRIASIIVLGVFICTSCAPLPQPGTALTDEERESAKKSCIARYTAVGAVGGGVVGLLLGGRHHKTEGALIGAAAGGALAFAIAWGHCLSVYSDLRSFPVAGAEETARRIGYASSQGNITRVESFSLNPSGVAPGGRVRMDGSYYVMAPEGTTEVKVVETRSLEFFDPSENQWKELGSIDQEVTSALGTRQAEGNFDIPSDAPEGLYRVTLKVAAQGREDQSTKELTVKKGLAMGLSAPAMALSGTCDARRPEPIQTGAGSVEAQDPSERSGQHLTVTSRTLTVRQEPLRKSTVVPTVKQEEIQEALGDTSSAEGKWFRV